MSKLLGLNSSSGILETLKSANQALNVNSSLLGVDDDGTARQIRTDANGQLFNNPMAQYIATPFTLSDGSTTVLQLTSGGSLKVSMTTSKSIINIGDNLTLANGAFTSSYDLRSFSKIRIYGNCSVNQTLVVQYSDDNSNWKYIDSLLFLNDTDGNIFVNKVIDVPPNYLRIGNFSGASVTIGMRIVGIQ